METTGVKALSVQVPGELAEAATITISAAADMARVEVD